MSKLDENRMEKYLVSTVHVNKIPSNWWLRLGRAYLLSFFSEIDWECLLINATKYMGNRLNWRRNMRKKALYRALWCDVYWWNCFWLECKFKFHRKGIIDIQPTKYKVQWISPFYEIFQRDTPNIVRMMKFLKFVIWMLRISRDD